QPPRRREPLRDRPGGTGRHPGPGRTRRRGHAGRAAGPQWRPQRQPRPAAARRRQQEPVRPPAARRRAGRSGPEGARRGADRAVGKHRPRHRPAPALRGAGQPRDAAGLAPVPHGRLAREPRTRRGRRAQNAFGPLMVNSKLAGRLRLTAGWPSASALLEKLIDISPWNIDSRVPKDCSAVNSAWNWSPASSDPLRRWSVRLMYCWSTTTPIRPLPSTPRKPAPNGFSRMTLPSLARASTRAASWTWWLTARSPRVNGSTPVTWVVCPVVPSVMVTVEA